MTWHGGGCSDVAALTELLAGDVALYGSRIAAAVGAPWSGPASEPAER